MGVKSRQLRASIKQARASGIPVSQAVKVAKQIQSGVLTPGAGGASLATVAGPLITGAKAGITAIGQRLSPFLARPAVRQAAIIGGTTAGAVALGEALDGQTGGRRGGLKGVVLVDASTGLNLGVISRRKALRVLQRTPTRRLPAKTKFLSIQNGCVQEVKT